MKNLLASIIAAATSFGISSANAADGTINFMGDVLDQACTVNIDSGNNLNVNMGKVAKTAFNGTEGSEANATKFTIRLSNCPASVSSAKIRFDGANDPKDTSLLAINPGPGSATGVAIKLMTADKAPLGLNQNNSYSYTLNSTADNNLDFYAAYRATQGTVTAGTANAVANFTVNYN